MLLSCVFLLESWSQISDISADMSCKVGPSRAQAGWVTARGPSRAQVGGPKPGPSGWAQAGPKWVGPSWDLVAGPKLGPKKSQKIKILKIKICVAQNVGKVWISGKKILLAPFGAFWANFLRGPEKSKKCNLFDYFPWWGKIHNGSDWMEC